MSVRTFWIICIRIIGFWILLEWAMVLPTLILLLLSFQLGIKDIGYFLFLIGCYVGILQLLIFRTTWIIDTLKLEKGIREEKIENNFSYPTILQIGIIIIGGMSLINALTGLSREIYFLFQENIPFKDSSYKANIIVNILQILIAYLLMTNSRWFVELLHKEKMGTKE
jgi:hypothetical protein